MRIIRTLLFVYCSLFFTIVKAQQEAQFTHYIFNGLYINPAYAGYKEDIFVNSFYRSQWTGLQGAPQTISLAADGAVNNNKVGLGVLFDQDKIGAQSSTAFYANYAYRLQIGNQENSTLALGLGFGFVQNSLNGNELIATQGNDSYIPTGNQSTLLPDGRLGVLYTNDNFFAGASADNLIASHMHRAANSLAPVPVTRGYFTVGSLVYMNDQTKLKPSVLLKYSPGELSSIDINTFILLNDVVWLGGTYRTSLNAFNSSKTQGMQKSSAIVAMAEFFVNDTFRIGYAFDYSLNKIGNYGYGSHELSVSFLLKRNKQSNPAKSSYF